MTIDDKIQSLLKHITRLSELIQMENNLLAQPGRQVRLTEIIEEKQALSLAYEQQAKIVDEDKELKTADSILRHRLSEAITVFQDLAEENRVRLAARMEVAKRVFSVIQEAAKDYRGSLKTYGSTGSTGTSENQTYQPAVSVGINQEL